MSYMSNEQLKAVALPPGQRRLALVIGVNSSASATLVPLQYAERDAALMAEVLQTRCNFELFKPTLLGSDASTDAVRNAALKLSLQAEKDDLLLFYFSGHGQQMNIEADMQSTYIVTANFDEEIVEVDNDAHLSLPWLREKLLLKTKAERVLIILDCCFAEDIRTPPDRYLEELRQRITYYFEMPGTNDGTRRSGLRVALAASSYDQTAREQDGTGIMTGLLLKALSGEEDEVLGNDGNITVNRLTEYIKEHMPPQQKPAISISDTGGYEYILAQYPERAAELRRKHISVVNECPNTYIPFPRKDSFQPRPHEFETLERLLFPVTTGETPPPRVGLVGVIGMGGIGKTQLAVELAYRYQDRFPSGVFWMPATGTTLPAWQRQFADLAVSTDYLREDDDTTKPDNEMKRASHLCRYLANHPDALLILDNVENTDLVLSALTAIAGKEARCAILYTSRNTITPHGVKRHVVERLPVGGALNLLLTHRPALLPLSLQENTLDAEAQAARSICQYVDYLPLALTLLRDLLQDEYLTLAHLAEQLKVRGAFEITKDYDETEARLFTTFQLGWNKITDAGAQHLFQLAAYFPEATAIPLWLLGIAAGLGETGNTRLEPLGRARLQLQKWSMIEVLENEQIRLHPLIREFGRQLVSHDTQGKELLQEAGQRLNTEFTDIDKLEQRAFAVGYWRCLEQVQQAYQYAQILDATNIERLERIERWMSRDSSLLTTDGLWPERMPGLFYQLLYNHMLEVGYQPALLKQSKPWIRQLEWVGTEDDLLLREFKHPDTVTCVAYTPNSNTVATGCGDGLLRLWDVASGVKRAELPGHTDRIMCLAISHDGTTIVTGSDDASICIWNIVSGKLVYTLRGSTQAVRNVAFSPDGTRIVAVSEDGIGRVWDIASQEQIAILSARNIRLRQALFTDDGERIVSCSEYAAYIWDIANECVVQSTKEKPKVWIRLEENLTHELTPEVEGVLILNNRPTMISIDFAQAEEHPVNVKIVNIEKQEIITQIARDEYARNPSLVAPIVSSDQKKIALSFYNAVEIWSLHNKPAYITSLTHAVTVTALSFSPNGKHIVTGAEDGKARLWSISHISKTIIEDNLRSAIVAVCFSTDGKQIALNNSFNINIRNTSNKTSPSIEIPLNPGLFPNIDQVVFSSNNSFLLTYGYSGISIVNVKNAQIRIIKKEATNICCFSPNGNMVVNDTSEHNIQIRRVIDSELITQLQGHRSQVHLLAFSPDGTHLVSGSMDGTVRIWNMQDYSTIAILKNHVGGVTCLCISPDGKLVATGSLDGVVHIWSMQDGEELARLKRQRVAPSSMAFSPDSSLLLVNDRYAYTSLWQMDQLDNGQLVGTYTTATEVKALHWQDNRHILLAAIDALGYEPQIYHLALEGEW